MDSAPLATNVRGGTKQRRVCIEQMVLNHTVEGVARAFKEVLSPWGFDVLLDRPRWQGGREMSSDEEEEMLVRAISVAHEDQIQAVWDMWKCLHALGLHVVPIVRGEKAAAAVHGHRAADDPAGRDIQAHVAPWHAVVGPQQKRKQGAESGGLVEGGARTEHVSDTPVEMRRKSPRQRVPRRQLVDTKDDTAATALDMVFPGGTSGGLPSDHQGGGRDDDVDYEVDPSPVKKGGRKPEAKRLENGEKKAKRHLTDDGKMRVIRDALRQWKHSAAHLDALSKEHTEHITRISRSLAHASCPGRLVRGSEHGMVWESIRRLQRAAAMLPGDVDIDGEVLVCVPHIERIARCLTTLRGAY